MLQSLRDALRVLAGSGDAWERMCERVDKQVHIEHVAPGTSLRAMGDVVNHVLLVDCGLIEIATPGEPPRWAVAGSMIGIADAMCRASSPVHSIARRYSRVMRIPAPLLWNFSDDARESVLNVARLARVANHGLHDLPPDPLVVTALLEELDEHFAHTIVAGLRDAVSGIPGAMFVDGAAVLASSDSDFATMLHAHESRASMVIYVVRSSDADRAVKLVEHADHTIVFQRVGDDAPFSAALRKVSSASQWQNTELVCLDNAGEPVAAATRQIRSPLKVHRIHRLPDPSSSQLKSLLIDLRARAREHEALREFPVLGELTSPELAFIQSTLQWTRVDGGSVLLQQGERAECAVLVKAGRLEEVRTSNTGERQLSIHGPGNLIGTSAVLRNGIRTTSVRALRDSTVARLDAATFGTLLERSTAFARAIAKLVASDTSGASTASTPRRATTIAVASLAEYERVHAFVRKLASVSEEVGLSTAVVDAAELNNVLGPAASNTRRGEVGDADIIRWLDRLERDHDLIILACDREANSWTRRAMRQADHMILVADGTTSPELRPIEQALADALNADAVSAGTRHLVLLQPSGTLEATGTGAWLENRPQHTHHHVRDGEASDIARLTRRLCGRAVALALSGASARATAHLGVVRAMEELRIPIDIVSGSSSGGGVAAIVASGMRNEEALSRAVQIITTGAPRLMQFQPPITAITSGAGADRALQDVFGNRQLEDQFIPAVLTAVDIRRHRAVHLTRGPIWKLMRASGSLPLLWPPVWHEEDLLVDGGIINYMPADVFGREADNGLIIASNLDATAGTSTPAFENTLNYGTQLNSWRALARRMFSRNAQMPPGIIDILFHTMAIPSFQQQEGLSALSEQDNVFLLTPPLGTFGLFEVDDPIGRALEGVAWEYARRELRQVAARWHARPEWRVVTGAYSCAPGS